MTQIFTDLLMLRAILQNMIRAVIARCILPKQSPVWYTRLRLRWKGFSGDCRAAKDAARNEDTGLPRSISYKLKFLPQNPTPNTQHPTTISKSGSSTPH